MRLAPQTLLSGAFLLATTSTCDALKPAAFNAKANAPDAFYSQLKPCPAACGGAGPSNWTVYNSLDRLQVCEEPMVLDFAIHNSLADSTKKTAKLRTCTVGNAQDDANALLHRRAADAGNANVTLTQTASVDFDLTVSGKQGFAGADHLKAAMQSVQTYTAGNDTGNSLNFLVGYSQGAVVALYSGAAIDNVKTVPSVLERISNELKGTSPSSAVVQLCGSGRNADYTFGVAVSTTGDVAAVQQAVVSWSTGTCYSASGDSSKLSAVTIAQVPMVPVVQSGSAHSNSTKRSFHALKARATCRTATVVSGDSCGSLATKCGITAAQFTSFNPSSTLCSTLAVGQKVCCSSGSLPDLSPPENSDGSCASYTVQAGDYCALIAATYGLTIDQLGQFNTKTWGWNGCDDLAAGINICLSAGNPPLPAPMANAICGPVVAGSSPKSGVDLADLNPCPLNSCCDVWGQCGTTPEFCTITPGPTGNPGTAPPGENGCISNCGTDIENNGSGPASFLKVTYYESWNMDRPCLVYSTSRLANTDYTHVHWGFATVDSSFNVGLDDSFGQLKDFMALSGKKKIVSFGGWGFSTDQGTFDLIREAMNPGNVDTFVRNIVNYLNSNGWDGVDMDWEYPGAPDIPGIPAGLASDGPNYLAFLAKLRAALGSSKTISIAAPASYWYLKQFPIGEMAQYVDYIVYMTYDLHGQWDYGNQFSQDGCPAGNCARSHVNLTETMYALSMITKAGVPTNKITVGVSSYGRSFGLTNPGACQASLDSPGCTIVGPDSGATPGRCTEEAGYISNAEINDIQNGGAVYFYDAASDSDTLFWDNNWVAWMTDETKSGRISKYQGLNLAGTADWAVDLQAFTDDVPGGGSAGNGSIIYYPPSIWQDGNGTPTIGCDDCTIVLPPMPLPTPVIVTYTLTTSILVSTDGTTSTQQTTIVLPPFTISDVPVWPVTIHSGDPEATFTPKQSIMPPVTVIPLPSTVIIAPPLSGTYDAFPTSTSGTTGAPVPWLTSPTFPSASHSATVQAQPTQSVNFFPPLPPVAFIPPVAPVVPVCTVGCGVLDCGLFGCGGGCGTFGCDGGCGVGFCGGGCSGGGCGPGCGLGDCEVTGGGGGSFPITGPPPTVPPTADGEYEPPVVDCSAVGANPVIPPPLNPPSDPEDHESGPADSDGNDFDNSGSGNGTPSSNPSGTNIHINSGCALVNGSPRCNSNAGSIANLYSSSYNVASNPSSSTSSATLLYGFNSSDHLSLQQKPTCQMNAQWPSSYGDVYLGADGHLYDGSGNQINNQGCSTPDSSHGGAIINPYYDPRPAGSCIRSDAVIAISFVIRAKGWITDGGAALKKQVAGCGATTFWESGADSEIETDGSGANIGQFLSDWEVSFSLPITFKSGCVGRAMVSAGAPAGSYC